MSLVALLFYLNRKIFRKQHCGCCIHTFSVIPHFQIAFFEREKEKVANLKGSVRHCIGLLQQHTKACNTPQIQSFTSFCKYHSLPTAGIGIMGLFSARLVHSFLCSIYGVKNDSPKNMPWLRRYVANSLVPLRPKVIKYGLRFLMWTIRNVSKLCRNSINFILNFQFEKKSSLKNVRLVH